MLKVDQQYFHVLGEYHSRGVTPFLVKPSPNFQTFVIFRGTLALKGAVFTLWSRSRMKWKYALSIPPITFILKGNLIIKHAKCSLIEAYHCKSTIFGNTKTISLIQGSRICPPKMCCKRKVNIFLNTTKLLICKPHFSLEITYNQKAIQAYTATYLLITVLSWEGDFARRPIQLCSLRRVRNILPIIANFFELSSPEYYSPLTLKIEFCL